MPTSKITEEFRTEDVVIRGVTYKLRELSATEYDEIIKIASGPDDNADLAAVLKMMAVKSIIDPSLTVEDLGNKPYPVYSRILGAVNKLHFQNDEDASPNS